MWLLEWLRRQTEIQPEPEARLRILGLSLLLQDMCVLERLGKQHNWDVRFTSSPRQAFTLASQTHFELILCDRFQPGYPWREVMERFSACSPQSCILLVSPVADEYMWQEVLQRGGYDVLRRPLSDSSTLHAVEAVLRFTSPDSIPSEAGASVG